MNLSQLQARCRVRFRDPNNDVIADATWTDHLNAAYFQFLRAAKWTFLLTTGTVSFGAGAHRAALPTGAPGGGVKDVYDETNDHLLRALPPDLPDKQRRFLEAQNSKPVWYWVVGDSLYVLPAPSSPTTVRVWFYTSPTRLSAGTDVPVIPETYHEALVAGALERAHRDDGNYAAAQQYQAEFVGILQAAMRDLAEDAPVPSSEKKAATK